MCSDAEYEELKERISRLSAHKPCLNRFEVALCQLN